MTGWVLPWLAVSVSYELTVKRVSGRYRYVQNEHGLVLELRLRGG